MPAEQRGSPFRTPRGWGVRWKENGRRPQESGFASKSDALRYFRETVAPRLGRASTIDPGITLAAFVDLYLETHALNVEASSLAVLRDRLRRATGTFGDVTLREFESQAPRIAVWRAPLAEGSRFGATQALRQTLEQAVRWGVIARNPAKLAGPIRRRNAPRSSRSPRTSSTASPARPARTLRLYGSPPRPDSGRASGSRSNAATCAATIASFSSSGRLAATRSAPTAKRRGAGAAFRSRRWRSPRSTSSRRASERRCYSRLRAARGSIFTIGAGETSVPRCSGPLRTRAVLGDERRDDRPHLRPPCARQRGGGRREARRARRGDLVGRGSAEAASLSWLARRRGSVPSWIPMAFAPQSTPAT